MRITWPLPNVVFERATQNRPVSVGIFSANKDTQGFAWIGDDGVLQVGVVIYHEGKPAQVLSIALPTVDVLLAFRALRLLDALPTLRDTDLGQIISVCLLQAEPDNGDEQVLLDWVKSGIGSAELETIRTKLPIGFIDTLESVAALPNVTLDRDAVTDEVEAGRLEYSDRLAALKIEHPDTRRARHEKRRQLYGEWEPHFLVYFEAKNVPSEDRKDALEYCNRIALYASAKGVEAADLCVGIALYIFALRSDSIAGIAAAIAKVLTRGDTPVGGLFVGRGSIEATTLQLLTIFLENRFASREAHQYASLLKQLYNDLEKMPVVHPDL